MFSRGEVQAWCPPCHLKSQKLGCWNSLVAGGFVAALGLGMVATGGRSGWFLLNACLIALLAVPTVVVHELSHALAGRLLGVRILGITIGQGRLVLRRRILGANIEWRLLPLSGFTIPGAAPAHRLRARMLLLVLAGPLMHLLVVVALVCSARFWGLRLGSFTSEAAPLAALLTTNAMMLVLDLWPRQTFTDRGLISNDVRTLLKIPFMSEKQVQGSLAAVFAREALEATRRGQRDEALRLSKMALEASGESQGALIVMGSVLCSMGSFGEAREIFRRLLERDDLSRTVRLVLLNDVAWANVNLRDGQLLSEAGGRDPNTTPATPA